MNAPIEPVKPRIDPNRVDVDYVGFVRRFLFVRAPEALVAGDLADPEIWAKVQANSAKALRKHDGIYITAYDESWCAEAIVADADGAKAVLAKPKLTDLKHDRFNNLFGDENYQIQWNGAGFVVVRRKDGHVMTQPAALAAHAERDLRQLYPSGRPQ